MSEIEPQEIKISYRRPLFLTLKKVTTSFQVNSLMREYFKQKECSLDYVEYLWMICLNRCNGVLGINQVSQGGSNGTSLTIPQMLQLALMQHASAVIVIHNHPSGTLKASKQDLVLNKRVTKAFEAIWIQQLDHLILTTEGYLSFKDDSLM